MLAGVLAGCTGLAYAELSARFPEAAGAAAFVAEGFQSAMLARATGYLVLFTGIVIAASLACGAAGYLTDFLPIPAPALAGLFVVVFLSPALK